MWVLNHGLVITKLNFKITKRLPIFYVDMQCLNDVDAKYTSIHVCMYACMHVCMYAYIHVCRHVHVCMYV